MVFRVFVLSHVATAYNEARQQQESLAIEPFFVAQPKHKELVKNIPANELSQMIINEHEYEEVAVAEAHLELTNVGIAMTRYRLEHGSFPEKLDTLVPRYLNEIPLDPFDGKPLRLLLKENQHVVYSIGPDGKDDHGKPLSRGYLLGGDITFALTAPKDGR